MEGLFSEFYGNSDVNKCVRSLSVYELDSSRTKHIL